MNIVERGKAFVQSLWARVGRSVWDWRKCPHCGSTLTSKWGTYVRRPWCFGGRREVVVQRHRCQECGRTYSETSPWLVRRSWYGREVHRCAVDHWLHARTSLRRTAELVRSWVGKQERYCLWRLGAEEPSQGERCWLSASTVHRWLDRAGEEAERSVPGQLAGVETSEQFGADGLWVRLRGKGKRVVLLLVDSVTGVVWPPLVVRGEKTAGPWERLFAQAREAGLELERVRGVTSDGVTGLADYLRRKLFWVNHQRCVWHVWRNLAGELGRAVARAAQGLAGAAAQEAREQARRELGALLHQVLDAPTYEQAEAALATLRGHPLGARLGQMVSAQMDKLFFHLTAYGQGLGRVAPEWCWRDFRLRLSRGRNHGSAQRYQRAALVWAIYRNFTPRQRRSERKRRYRHPGQSPLEVARASPGEISYLDALGV
ncbi:MAG: transposase [Anaerolineae bacterium]|nr:transposase [Anaerolineae bacterium]